MSGTDTETARLELASKLPSRARWLVRGTPLSHDFGRVRERLRCVNKSEVLGGEIEPEWRQLHLFGEQDFADGGGAQAWLGVHAGTGEVFGLDVERGSTPLFFLSSDVARFIRSCALFDAALRLGVVPVKDVLARAAEIDVRGFPRSEWRVLGEHLA